MLIDSACLQNVGVMRWMNVENEIGRGRILFWTQGQESLWYYFILFHTSGHEKSCPSVGKSGNASINAGSVPTPGETQFDDATIAFLSPLGQSYIAVVYSKPHDVCWITDGIWGKRWASFLRFPCFDGDVVDQCSFSIFCNTTGCVWKYRSLVVTYLGGQVWLLYSVQTTFWTSTIHSSS